MKGPTVVSTNPTRSVNSKKLTAMTAILHFVWAVFITSRENRKIQDFASLEPYHLYAPIIQKNENTSNNVLYIESSQVEFYLYFYSI